MILHSLCINVYTKTYIILLPYELRSRCFQAGGLSLLHPAVLRHHFPFAVTSPA